MFAVRIRLVVVAAALALPVLALLALAPGARAAGTVTIAVAGQGSATGPGINCTQTGGPDCTESYADEQGEECFPQGAGKPDRCEPFDFPPSVTFTAGGDANGFVFDGWTGCDSVTGRECTHTVDESTTLTARFRDAQGPSVSAPSPSSGTRRGTITLATSASDNASVTKVEFYNGVLKLGEDASAPYEFAWNTSTVSDGPKSITARAYDAAGNMTSSAASAFVVDNTAPTLGVTAGPNGQTFGPGTTQTWNLNPSDATSAVVAQCRVLSAGSTPAFAACSAGNAGHSVANLPDGSYTFEARASDAAGNVSAVQSRAFAIDATPPETTIGSGPADGSSSMATSATFGFGASEAGSTFECRVYPAALTAPAFGACSSAAEHTASGFAPGVYAFEVRATDPYGNLDGTPAKRTFTVAAPGTDPGPGTESETDGGTGPGRGTETSTSTTPGTTTTNTTTTTTTTTTVTTPTFDPRMSHGFDFVRGRAVFYKLQVRGLPAGSKLRVACKGKGCSFKRKAIKVKSSTVNVLKSLKRLRLRVGAKLTISATSASGQRKIATYRIARRSKVSYRCSAAGGRLGSC